MLTYLFETVFSLAFIKFTSLKSQNRATHLCEVFLEFIDQLYISNWLTLKQQNPIAVVVTLTT